MISEYPQGIRFLLLVDKKEDWSTKIKKSFADILAGFDADEHIFTLAGVVERMKKNYPQNPGPFQEILAFLEWQFGEKEGNKVPGENFFYCFTVFLFSVKIKLRKLK